MHFSLEIFLHNIFNIMCQAHTTVKDIGSSSQWWRSLSFVYKISHRDLTLGGAEDPHKNPGLRDVFCQNTNWESRSSFIHALDRPPSMRLTKSNPAFQDSCKSPGSAVG